MQVIATEGLRTCPKCGSKAIMRKNASKRFQIHCKKCNCCTAWVSKTEAVILWYNNAAKYEEIMRGGKENDLRRTHPSNNEEA